MNVRIAPTKPFTDPQTAARFDMLAAFYEDATMFRSTLLPFLDDSPPCSLRLIDWLMTNYSKDRGVVFSRSSAGRLNVVLDTEYRNWSKTWRRPLFDMFRRGDESRRRNWMHHARREELRDDRGTDECRCTVGLY